MLSTLLQALRTKPLKRAAVRPYRPHFDVLEERRVLSGIAVGIDPVSNPAFVPENRGVAEFKVYRVGGIGGDKPHTVTVQYKIEGNSLTADPRKDLDRSALTGTLRFGEAETVKVIRVAVFNDTTDENDETFTVRLTRVSATNGAEASIGNATGTFTVLDDDDPPTVKFGGAQLQYEWNESAKVSRFTVELSAVSEKEVTVFYVLRDLVDADQTSVSTVGGDLTVDGGLNAAQGQLKFKPGLKKNSVFLRTVQDEIVEDNELFSLSLDSPVNATLANPAVVYILIKDTDKLNISIKSMTAPFDTAQVIEAGINQYRSATLQIVWDANVETSKLKCQIDTLAGTATFNVDHGAITGEISGFHLFPNAYSISSPSVTGDLEDEGEENFFVYLHTPSDRLRIVRSKVKIVIVDDD